ncbi:MAG: ATP-binding cassette domain-containing protein [Deltaproteobacteria bacterium]|nr:MAG: ATP-binding cassette domain-containing protein [Deltaproteobacteria bacterium]
MRLTLSSVIWRCADGTLPILITPCGVVGAARRRPARAAATRTHPRTSAATIGRRDRVATCRAIEASDTRPRAGFPDSTAFAIDSDRETRGATAAGTRCRAGAGACRGRARGQCYRVAMVAEPAAAPSALAVRGLRVALPDGRVLIDGVDLAIGAGEVVVLLGGSGAGKSTFARVLFEPDELAAAGFDVVAAELALDREQLGLVPQAGGARRRGGRMARPRRPRPRGSRRRARR